MEALAYIIYSIALRTRLEAPQLNLQYKKARSLSILKTIPSLLYLFEISNRYENE